MLKKVLSCILALTLLLSIIPMAVVSAESSTFPQNMLYIKTEETGKRLYQRVAVEVGQTYHFSFGISSDISFTPVCRTDSNRYGVDANIQEVSKGTKGDVTLYTYSYTIPETDNNGNAMTSMVFFGIQIKSACEGYFFDASVYNAADESKTELFDIAAFSTGTLDRWAWDFDIWFASSVHSVNNVGFTEWTNEAGTTTLKVLPFDDSLLVDETVVPKMLYINTSAPKALYARASVTVGETYYFNFKLTSGVEFSTVCFTNGSRYAVDASVKLVSSVVKGKCTEYTYSYTIPETDNKGNAMTDSVFFGIRPKSGFEGYFFDASVCNVNDKYEVELLENPNFSSGTLYDWAWDWDIWFRSDNATLTEWSNADATTTLKVVDYNEELLKAEDISPKMLYINTTQTGKEFYQRAVVEPGKTYYFSFTLKNGTDFKAVNRTNGDRISIVTTSDVKLVSQSYSGKYAAYTYSYTIPATYTNRSGEETAMTDSVFFGIKFNEAYDGYLFNTSIYCADDENKTELFENPDFALGVLDRWAWDYDIWFAPAASSTNNVGFTEWSNDEGTTTLRVVKFDESVLDTEKETTKMLYIKTSSAKDFYQRANVIAGETYYFSFALSSDIKFKPICRADESRPGINADIQQVNMATKGDISIYTYSYTLPETADVTDLVFFGIRFTEACEGYFFDASLKHADDELGFEFFENPDFASGTMVKWALEWDKWFTASDSEWTNGTSEAKVLDYDDTLMNPGSEYMLHIKTSGPKVLYQRAKVEVGKTYYFEFTVNSDMEFTPVCNADDKRANVDASITLVSAVEIGGSTKYTYSYTIPETDANGNAMSASVFFGIRLSGATEGYFFDGALYEAEDKYQIELMENPDFASGNLDRWALGWDIWFAPASSSVNNVGLTQWTDGKTTLEIVDYNDDLLKSMLFVRYESVDMQGESLIQKIKNLEADTEYTVSFNYHFASGALNETIDFTLMGDPLNADSLVERLIQSSATNNTCITSSSDNGVTATYTFKLDSATMEKYQGYYAGFYFKISPRIVTEFYISDFTIYRTDDSQKTNLFVKDNFDDMYGWSSNWKNAAEGSTTFGWDTVDYLDYLAQYVPYETELFINENDVVHYGDVNFDGEIDIRDLVAIKKHIVNLGEYIVNIDCNKDGSISTDDLVALRKHLLTIESIVWEDDGISSLQATLNLSGGADAEAAVLKSEIDNNPDTLLAANKGTVYYVSENGAYANEGTSESAPMSLQKLRDTAISSGDTVLFKRGDTFRISNSLTVVSGVSYGAYGSGAKPIISGSLKNYADKTLWTTEDGFVWKADVIANDVGNVVFNNGEYVGLKKSSLDSICNDGDFYYDFDNQAIYLYLRQVNPANFFDSIEISSSGTLIGKGGSSSNITIENISFKHASIHGINIYVCKNIKITGCEFSWIGGAYNNTGSRYGNAIQFWDSASDCEVTNNHIYQIYDAALTFQGNDVDAVYSGLTYKNNLVEYTSMNFEFWHENTVTISDIDFSENIMRFAGYGFSGIQRANKGNQAYILAWHNAFDEGVISNFSVTNNIFDIANCYFFFATKCIDSLGVSGNTYYQNNDSIFSITASRTVYATDKETFEAVVKEVDAEATVNWVEN